MENKAIVVGIGLKKDSLPEIKENLIEIEALLETYGFETVAHLTQTLEKYNPALLMGSGKVEEITELVKQTEATVVVVDHVLTGVQVRNLEKFFEIPVIDRSQLIIEIFAQRAQTHEGKLQVELATLEHQATQMVGGWLGSLSRQGGGLKAKGSGEKAIEIDRRRMREKIQMLKVKLKDLEKHREQNRQKRKRTNILTFALIGYTNAGKSTLFNVLTKGDAFAEDKLFATLDPKGKTFLLDEQKTLLTDTVGFIHKLPTQLIQAFKSTLEESSFADVMIHVVDASHPNHQKHVETVNDLIETLGWSEKPIIHVYNKMDLIPAMTGLNSLPKPFVKVSAIDKTGINELTEKMILEVQNLKELVELFIPNDEFKDTYEVQRLGKVEKLEQGSTGTLIKVWLNKNQVVQFKKYKS